MSEMEDNHIKEMFINFVICIFEKIIKINIYL